jgi:hypothetical protein
MINAEHNSAISGYEELVWLLELGSNEFQNKYSVVLYLRIKNMYN